MQKLLFLLLMPLMFLGFTACNDSDDVVPPGSKLPIKYNLEIHFVDADGNSLTDNVAHKSDTEGSESDRDYYCTTEMDFHQVTIDNEKRYQPLHVVVCNDGSSYLSFSAQTNADYLVPSIEHVFKDAGIFGYKPNLRGEMVSRWKCDKGYGNAVCTGITFDGKEYDVTPVTRQVNELYILTTYEVTITLPDAAE